jgi:hypothetical protein
MGITGVRRDRITILADGFKIIVQNGYAVTLARFDLGDSATPR